MKYIAFLFLFPALLLLALRTVPAYTQAFQPRMDGNRVECMMEDPNVVINLYRIKEERAIESERAKNAITSNMLRNSRHLSRRVLASQLNNEGVEDMLFDLEVCPAHKPARKTRRKDGLQLKTYARTQSYAPTPVRDPLSNPPPFYVQQASAHSQNETLGYKEYMEKLRMRKIGPLSLCPKNGSRNGPRGISTLSSVLPGAMCRLQDEKRLKTVPGVRMSHSFSWEPYFLYGKTSKIFRQGARLLELDRTSSHIFKTLKSSAFPYVCIPSESIVAPPYSDSSAIYPFKNRSPEAFNIKDFQYINNQIRIRSDNMMLVKKLLGGCKVYTRMYQSRKFENPPSIPADLTLTVEHLISNHNMIGKEIDQWKDDIRKRIRLLYLQDYVDLVERQFLLEIEGLHMILCNTATEMYKATAANAIIQQDPFVLQRFLKSQEKDEDTYALLITLVDPALVRLGVHTSMLENMTRFLTEITDKKKNLAFLSNTYYPSETMSKLMLQALLLRLCDVEHTNSDLRAEGMKLKQKIEEMYVQHLVEKKAILFAQSLEKKESLDFIKQAFHYNEKVQMALVRSMITVLNLYASEIDVLKEEMVTSMEYAPCFRSDRLPNPPPIQPDIALGMLASLEIRRAIQREIVLAMENQKRHFAGVSKKHRSLFITPFDLLDQEMINDPRRETILRQLKKKVSSIIPMPIKNQREHCLNAPLPVTQERAEILAFLGENIKRLWARRQRAQ